MGRLSSMFLLLICIPGRGALLTNYFSQNGLCFLTTATETIAPFLYDSGCALSGMFFLRYRSFTLNAT